MIDIIIPTMLKTIDTLKWSITECIQSNYINQIIIINNTNQDFNKVINIEEPKLQIINCKTNIYVNPAWNLGVETSEANQILIMNDDICVNHHTYKYIDELMSKDSVGLCSINTKNISSLDEYVNMSQNFDSAMAVTEKFNYNPKKQNVNGWFFCLHKSLWKPLPKDMSIFYGDFLIYNRIRALGLKTYCINNIHIGHILHATIDKCRHDKMFKRLRKRDNFLYKTNRHQFILN